MKQIKQQTFAKELNRHLQKSKNPTLKDLSVEDTQEFVSLFWEVLAEYLFDGHRVIFDGWISFFTNPVKRKCYDVGHTGYKWSYKHRIRFRPLDKFKGLAERDLTESDYQALDSTKKKEEKSRLKAEQKIALDSLK